MKTKTIEKNIELVRCLFEKQASQDDISLFDQLFSEEVQLFGPASGQVIKGLNTLKKMEQGYHHAYPNRKFEIEEIFGYADQVFVRWACIGQYREGYKGISPQKKEGCIWGVSIYRIFEQKIQEIRQFWDRLGILEQIGEVTVSTNPVEPGYYNDLLKGLGMEKYVEKASLITPRERECLEFLLQGKTAKETAVILVLSQRTVESYFETLKKKMKCTNKGQLFSTAKMLKKLDLL